MGPHGPGLHINTSNVSGGIYIQSNFFYSINSSVLDHCPPNRIIHNEPNTAAVKQGGFVGTTWDVFTDTVVFYYGQHDTYTNIFLTARTLSQGKYLFDTCCLIPNHSPLKTLNNLSTKYRPLGVVLEVFFQFSEKHEETLLSRSVIHHKSFLQVLDPLYVQVFIHDTQLNILFRRAGGQYDPSYISSMWCYQRYKQRIDCRTQIT